jgi:hypothetical protein
MSEALEPDSVRDIGRKGAENVSVLAILTRGATLDDVAADVCLGGAEADSAGPAARLRLSKLNVSPLASGAGAFDPDGPGRDVAGLDSPGVVGPITADAGARSPND